MVYQKKTKHKDILVKKQTKTKKIMQIIQICERGKWVHKIKHIYTDNEKLDPTGFVCVVFFGGVFFFLVITNASKSTHTVAALRNAHAFESAHPQSYVIAHMSFRGKLSPYKPNNRWNISIFNKSFLILAVMTTFIASRFVYQPHILLPVGVC